MFLEIPSDSSLLRETWFQISCSKLNWKRKLSSRNGSSWKQSGIGLIEKLSRDKSEQTRVERSENWRVDQSCWLYSFKGLQDVLEGVDWTGQVSTLRASWGDWQLKGSCSSHAYSWVAQLSGGVWVVLHMCHTEHFCSYAVLLWDAVLSSNMFMGMCLANLDLNAQPKGRPVMKIFFYWRVSQTNQFQVQYLWTHGSILGYWE